jgi:hypothetical protein
MRTTRTKKTRKMSGSPAGRLILPLALAAGLLAVPVCAAPKEKKPQNFGVVAGSIFRETGFSFAGVEVIVRLVPEPGDRKSKVPEWKGRTDARGEFAFRVPAPARYTVTVKAEAHRTEQREVELGIDERKELSISLAAAR